MSEDRIVLLEQKVERLEQQVEFLEKKRPGRRLQPIVVTESGVCGLDPSCDSKTCKKSSIYRYQQGCLGDACVTANREYYAEYRARKKTPSSTVQVNQEAIGGDPEEA